MIRYPTAERRALGDVENMRIRTPDGQEIPFSEVATVTPRQGFAVIKRTQRQRVVTVTADVDANIANAGEILASLRTGFLPQLLASYDGVSLSFEGQQRETERSISSLYRGLVFALFLIYAILAVIFRSYVQSLIIMVTIPFGLVGAVLGHLIMGHDLTILSLFGFTALSGIVVNDALVLLDYINGAVRRGTPIVESILQGGEARFRAIILTSLTTIAGLLPILAEKSIQAQFLIPMAISISFGLMFATFLTLFFIPALYLLLHDVSRIVRWLLTGDWPSHGALEAAMVTKTVGVAEDTQSGVDGYAKTHPDSHRSLE
jgi:multidrug efflux pump subunit AcrB